MSDDVLKLAELDADVVEKEKPGEDKLKFLADKVRELQEIEARIEKGQALLEQLGNEAKHLSESVIPNYMVNDCGVESLKLADGSVVEVPKQYFGSLTAENKDAGHEWLEKNGYGDLIKTTVTITYDRKDRKKALAFVKKLQTAKTTRSVELKEAVHASTLKSFVKERITEGDASFPQDTFSVYVKRKTKIKVPKAKKEAANG